MSVKSLRALIGTQRRSWHHRLNSIAIQWRWPELRITHPCVWSVDNLDNLELQGRIHIGPFTEIVVESRSSYSRVAGRLRIGNRTVIGSSGNIRAGGGAISIGQDCLIAQQVSLIASGHTVRAGAIYHELRWDEAKTGVTIEDNVWIGCGVTVLPGCTIGRGAVIGAGSVVTKDVPAGTVWAGVPAKPLRKIE